MFEENSTHMKTTLAITYNSRAEATSSHTNMACKKERIVDVL